MLQTSFGLLWMLWHSKVLAVAVPSEQLFEPEMWDGNDQNWPSSPHILSQIAPPTITDKNNFRENTGRPMAREGGNSLVIPGGMLAQLSQVVEPAPAKRFFSILSPSERLRALYKQRPKPAQHLVPRRDEAWDATSLSQQ